MIAAIATKAGVVGTPPRATTPSPDTGPDPNAYRAGLLQLGAAWFAMGGSDNLLVATRTAGQLFEGALEAVIPM